MRRGRHRRGKTWATIQDGTAKGYPRMVEQSVADSRDKVKLSPMNPRQQDREKERCSLSPCVLARFREHSARLCRDVRGSQIKSLTVEANKELGDGLCHGGRHF